MSRRMKTTTRLHATFQMPVFNFCLLQTKFQDDPHADPASAACEELLQAMEKEKEAATAPIYINIKLKQNCPCSCHQF